MVRRKLLFMVLFFSFTMGISLFQQSVHAQQKPPEEHITVVLRDYSLHPSITQAKAGKVTFEAVNEGMSIHELVILQTDLKPTALPRKETKPQKGMLAEYLVNEDDERLETIDEIEEFPSGTSQMKTVLLNPGNYVLFCNLPGHYDKGMYTSFRITP